MADTHSTRSATAAPGTTVPTESGAHDRSPRTDQQENWLIGRVRETATSGIESQKRRATDGLGTIAQAVRTTTEQLRSQQHESLAEYVQQGADQIERVAQQLKNKDVGALVEDAQRLARRNPAAFAGTAFALGLVTARFLKSSGDEHGSSEHGSYGQEQHSWSQARSGWQSGDRSGTFERGPAGASSQYTPPHGDATVGGSAAPTEDRASRSTRGTSGSPTSTDSMAGRKETRPAQGRRETERS